MAKGITNTSASVHARLLNVARSGSRPFRELLQMFAMERFLHRLGKTRHADRFVLKGAMLMRAWDPLMFRTTMDIDLHARLPNDIAVLEAVARDTCTTAVGPDGLRFDPSAVRGETIIEDADYSGVRLTLGGMLGKALIPMQIDVAFDDAITPGPQPIELPSILNMPGTRLLAYPPETVVAEKLQVMLFRAEANSRMKDFHDVWWISRHFSFDGLTLARAIATTCTRRRTEVPAEPTALSGMFANDPARRALWRVFRSRIATTECPTDFGEVIVQLRRFLSPVVTAVRSGEPLRQSWDSARGWTEASLDSSG